MPGGFLLFFCVSNRNERSELKIDTGKLKIRERVKALCAGKHCVPSLCKGRWHTECDGRVVGEGFDSLSNGRAD